MGDLKPDASAPTLRDGATPEEGRSASPKKNGRASTTPQLVLDMPLAEAEALATFEEIPDPVYQTSRMGRTRGQDDPMCDCSPEYGPSMACTDESGCINRLTQVECLPGVCRCGDQCANQRFQKHQYALVDIVKTPSKGFGLRARAPLAKDDFVYEYIGEVINHDTFLRRMAQYKNENIVHFYFMMLQRDEYIDATKRGGRGRLINHSCNPNCYVSKWHVGRHVRMGIFAKRAILAGEELTFNYNADRYGNDPQPCYCGEPNCVGTIGGRTQTDVVTMDERFIAALDIADQVAELRASLPRNKRHKILDDDFHPTLHAIDSVDDCARVMTAVRDATTNRKMIHMLLTRIQMTDSVPVLKTLVKLHGFVVMAGLLDEWSDDAELVHLVLACLAQWPLLARDKVVDSGVETQVHAMAEGKAGPNQALAQSLLDRWAELPSTFRIARRDHDVSEDDIDLAALRRAATNDAAARTDEPEPSDDLRRSLVAYREKDSAAPVPAPEPRARPADEKKNPAKPRPSLSVEDIIRQANAENEAQQRAREEAEAEAKRAEEARAEEARRAATRASKKHRAEAGDARTGRAEKRAKSAPVDLGAVERQLAKLVSALVVKQLSKVRDELDRDRFKKYAKDLTNVLCDKEKRNPKAWPPRLANGEVGLEELSDEKRRKMKMFAHEYIKKLVRHRRSAGSGDTSRDTSLMLDTSVDPPSESP
ncbi:Similar to S.cerevisiae protein SET2 (Histone methyltransferase with a role in transcriptional elongation) [Malassezia sympodialis ATCC 42132]|uniref:Histone-lysine N-methyltransferase, H3 lysine-36 specific n=1 Tax=Malassezia sympodialis (strain ATCC 42132) TaxID=1230383 RepID=A0A1M8A744_MALS4|nr:Similar to S.cerevisiae protein SET2 (Histone methyltransferase with a role in transcriptional elongation) [Malassezia sympodialis ATCC 42132]